MKRKMLPLALAVSAVLWVAAPASAEFGVADFAVSARNADHTVKELAASHPFALDVHLAMNTNPAGEPEGAIRRIQIDLPQGLIGNPLNVPRCSQVDFEGFVPLCPGSTQVGVLRGIVTDIGQVTAPVYNLTPPLGSAAAFAISIGGEVMMQRLSLVDTGSTSSVRLAGDLPPGFVLVDVEEEIWGIPADPAHDPERTCPEPDGSVIEGCSVGVEERPLLTLPASCAEPLRTILTVTSTGIPATTSVATALSRDAGGNPRPLAGCDAVPFDPQLTARAEAAALEPTSLSLGFEVPQHEGPAAIAAASIGSIRLSLPSGLALNPAVGSWLAGCPPAAIGLESAPGVEPVVFDKSPANCPSDSRIGSVRVRAPLVDHELGGGVYLASPSTDPFASRLTIYLVVEDEATGTMLKIPGRLDADPGDGRLAAVISDLPPFPFREMEIEFSGGSRASLSSPPSCGEFEIEGRFIPSTAPSGSGAVRSAPFALTAGPNGAPCPRPETDRNPVPSFQAGVQAPLAGRKSPLRIRVSRRDIDQHLGAFELTLPPGLLADLGSVPDGSAVGEVRVEAGVGPAPLQLAGTAYLAGPYHGAPYSLKIVVPARAGPVDLGTIVQRAALFVEPASAQVRVVSSPLPQILSGVPLELRGVTIDLDRPGFIRTPSSCEPMAVTGSATTALGRPAPLFTRFQVGDCASLPFKPRLSLRFVGWLGRNGHPGLTARLTGGPDEAGISSLGFTLPPGELLDLRHVRGLCGRGVAAERCPPSSRVGHLRLRSSFLGQPLEGTVQLRVPSHRLPDLSVELRSSRFHVVLHGRTTTTGGGLGIRFGGIPDVPISKAVLTLPGGPRGIVVNSASLCAGGPANAHFTAHSGKQRRLRVPVRLGGGC